MHIAKILKLTEDEKHTMFDLAGEGKNTIAPDLPEYIMSSEKVRVALRKAREVATEEDWDDFFKKLNEKGQSLLGIDIPRKDNGLPLLYKSDI